MISRFSDMHAESLDFDLEIYSRVDVYVFWLTALSTISYRDVLSIRLRKRTEA